MMTALYKVVLPDDDKLDHRRLSGLGLFERGKPQEIELSDEQVKSLKARRFRVTKKPAGKGGE